jgi:CheY-like chemotaxis protein
VARKSRFFVARQRPLIIRPTLARFLPHSQAVLQSGPRSRPAVLIAESEPDLRQLLDYLLRDAAYDTALAADGIAVVRTIARVAPDLLVLDLDLAGLDGLLALEVVRALTDSLPVVVITSVASPALEHARERLGVVAILRKPFRNVDLLDAVARGLDARAPARVGPP